MKRAVVVLASLIASIIFAACSSIPSHDEKPRAVASTIFAVSKVKGFKHHVGTGSSGLTAVGDGNSQELTTLLPVFDCESVAPFCKRGIGKPTVRLSVQSASVSGANVTVSVNYDIGPTETVFSGDPRGSYQRSTDSIPDGTLPIRADGSLTQSGFIPYGQLRKIELPYGMYVGLCVAASLHSTNDDDGACSGLSFDQVPDATIAARPLSSTAK
ncbi:hypothetical protein [Burkholderia gladioli]|uniref:hypothetical protein n=1 Tax=Burkholderia gladioli TaxID=28095 RepID=UPI00163E339E|nr:hypothetical protein [Burkholderia gladioli]